MPSTLSFYKFKSLNPSSYQFNTSNKKNAKWVPPTQSDSGTQSRFYFISPDVQILNQIIITIQFYNTVNIIIKNHTTSDKHKRILSRLKRQEVKMIK